MDGDDSSRHWAQPANDADDPWAQSCPSANRWLGCLGITTTCSLIVAVMVVAVTLFEGATDEERQLMLLGRCFGCVAVVAASLVYLVDPGRPVPDADDVAPMDEWKDSERIRQRTFIDGSTWQQKWCRQCKLWRPHRCGHCKKCGRCVLRLDHHCPWMGTCVGERNARFFVLFLLFAGSGLLSHLLVAYRRLGDLGFWTANDEAWAGMSFYIVVCCVCLPMPCMSFACMAFALSCMGLGTTGAMIADADVHKYQARPNQEMSPDECAVETINFFRCRGFAAYCLGPFRLNRTNIPCISMSKRTLLPREPAAESSDVEIQDLGYVEAPGSSAIT